MKAKIQSVLITLAVFAIVHQARAQGTAFTYQGHLLDNGAPFTGTAEVQFTLWDALSAGNQVAASAPATISVAVANGLFTTPVDFGGAAFNGAEALGIGGGPPTPPDIEPPSARLAVRSQIFSLFGSTPSKEINVPCPDD